MSWFIDAVAGSVLASAPAADEVPVQRTVEAPVAEAPVAEAPVAEAPVAEAPTSEAPAPAEPPVSASPPPVAEAPRGDPPPAVAAPAAPPPPTAVPPLVLAPSATSEVDAKVGHALPRYQRTRTGLLAGSGGSLAIALGLYVFTAIDMRPLAESCSESGLDSTFECIDRVRRNVRMLSAAMTASTAAVAMAGIGGMMWGKAHAAEDYLQRREPRDVRAYRAAGIVGVVLGGTALVGTYVAAVSSAFVGRCRTDDIDCAARTGQGLTAGLGAAALLTTTGAGLLGYGATYPRVLRGWQRRGGQFSMSPSRRGFTLGLSGQF